MAVHPKTGSAGVSTLGKDKIKSLYTYTDILCAIKTQNLYSVTANNEMTELAFVKVPKPIAKKMC